NVAGSVDDVDAMVTPERGRRGRRDRDAALLLLGHPVHRGRALVDLADLVRLARVEQDALGRRGLAGVDVGHDPDVADKLKLIHLRDACVLLSCDLGHRSLLTSGNAQMPCWPAPCDTCRPCA